MAVVSNNIIIYVLKFFLLLFVFLPLEFLMNMELNVLTLFAVTSSAQSLSFWV